MIDAPLRLYVNKALVAPGMSHVPLLYPFWGSVRKERDYLTQVPIHGYDPRCFTLVERSSDAEYVLVPHDYWYLKKKRPDLLTRMVAEARQVGKPLLIDASGDQDGVVTIPNARVLRINQYRFALPKNEIKVPVPCEDLLETYGHGVVPLREKSARASVGFVGWATLSPIQRIRSLIKEVPVRVAALFDPQQAVREKGVFWRERAIRVFRESSRVTNDFVIRRSYSGHATTLTGMRETNRREFVDRLLQNDYALIVKGDANEATRLYEALSLGRIPVILDTAMVLPLETHIAYRDFCVIVDWRDLHRAPDILADFHAKVSPEQFRAMQHQARDTFERYLRYDAFSPYLVALLRT